ncbi:uncharacterized mitochondrial protein-like protein [Tanacetum coccineum]
MDSSSQWKISRLDVKNAFLNGDLNEKVYITPSPDVPYHSGSQVKFVSHHDSALFVNRSSVGRIWLSLYVDDMIITEDDCDGIELQKAELSCRFAIKDLGVLHNKIVDIHLNAKAKYTPTDGDPLQDPSLYRTIVGSLVYLTVTHPYIAYVVHIACQFIASPTTVH